MCRRDSRMSSLEFLAMQVEEIFGEPSKEELERTLTKEELIKLCMHKKCCVQLNYWNPVHQFYLQLERKGRTRNKSPRKIQKLLKKLGNHYKNDPRRSFSREQIEAGRLEYWKDRKCWNVRWLDMNKENEATLERRISSADDEEQRKMNLKPLEGSEVPADSKSSEGTENKSFELNSLDHLEDAVDEIIETQSLNISTETQPELLHERIESNGSELDSLDHLEVAVDEIIETQSLNVSIVTQPELLHELVELLERELERE